jgi:hypothetical protein
MPCQEARTPDANLPVCASLLKSDDFHFFLATPPSGPDPIYYSCILYRNGMET